MLGKLQLGARSTCETSTPLFYSYLSILYFQPASAIALGVNRELAPVHTIWWHGQACSSFNMFSFLLALVKIHFMTMPAEANYHFEDESLIERNLF